MRITQELFDKASNAAFDAADDSPDEVPLSDKALLAFLAALGIRIEQEVCTCDPHQRMYCAFSPCQGGAALLDAFIWVPRTWADVRTGDVVRPVGQSEHAATVTAIGPALTWHVDEINGGSDAQYRPGEWEGERTVRRVTMQPVGLSGDGEVATLDGEPFTPEHGMLAGAPVEIRVTQIESDAIDIMGGWANRLDPTH